MSESVATHDAGVPLDGVPATTAGGLLRQLRESAGVHIDVLAGALKVPVARLQALEDDDYESFPDTVFMRGVASSICRALKVDAAPVLALLPQGTPIHLPPDRGLNTAFKGSGRRLGKGGSSFEQPKSRLVAIAVVVLLLAALAVAFLPLPMGGDGGEEGKAGSAGTAPAGVPAEAVEHQAPFAAFAPQGAAQAEPAVQQAVVQPDAVAPVAGEALASAAPAAAEAEAAKAAAQDAVLVIRARSQTWVQVRNAAGQVVLQKELAGGESYSAEGSPPWSVVIGRADAADAIVRGQAMDLKAIARSNVARFEVK